MVKCNLLYNIPQLKTTNSKLFSLSNRNLSLKNQKNLKMSQESLKTLLDGNFLPVCFLLEGREETKTGGKDYKGKRLFNKDSKIKVPIVSFHSFSYTTETNKSEHWQAMRTFIQVGLNIKPNQISRQTLRLQWFDCIGLKR